MSYVKNAFGERQECHFQREYRGHHVWKVRFSMGPVEVTEIKFDENGAPVPGCPVGIRATDDEANVNRLIDARIEREQQR